LFVKAGVVVEVVQVLGNKGVRTYVRWLLINLDAASTILIGRRGRW